MDLHLTSKIVLNKVAEDLYCPKDEVTRSQLTRCEKIPTEIVPDIADGVGKIADCLQSTIAQCDAEGRYCVLALGTGRSLVPVFDELIRRHRQGKISFRNVVVFTVYEFYPIPDGTTGVVISTRKQLCDQLLDQVDISAEHIFSPQENGTVAESCSHYEQLIQQYGGIDMVLVGIGRSGNIAANEPGSGISSTTRLMLMGQTTREEMIRQFAVQGSVPPCAITLGIQTLLSARSIILVAWGEEKADVIRQTVEGEQTSAVPASFLQSHNHVKAIINIDAAAHLTRIVHPWLVTSCHWNDKLVRSALVWLCMKTGKPLLKLTNKDYNEYGLSELLATYGSAYDANIKIFNDLQHTITGWPGGKPDADDTNRPERALPFPKRVIVFSPHPDDDVISMGGTLRRLVQQHHIVHVAYETSGNIAVGDEEVIRFMHFINGFNQLFCDSADDVIRKKYLEIKSYIEGKNDGDLDTKDILTVKGLIRRGEARTASTYNGIPLEQVHFLDLPFYESGRIEKNPMSEKDVTIIRNLLQKVQPHQIYVAGDLADPHGTHRKCTDAVLAAIDEERKTGASWLDHCRVWMYRGAWAEWEIENIEMCVPISPEELRAKRNSILKHQSQMESAPFLGNDERLFWQRSEDRNRATARLYNRLGLADYEAMEAFVEYKITEHELIPQPLNHKH